MTGYVCVDGSVGSQIAENWDWRGEDRKVISIRLGPVATGAVVLEDPSTVAEIQRQHRETIGVEMEGYGVALACSEAKNPPSCLIVKSVCDFADTDKNDSWQSFAAFTSARFAELLLLRGII